MSLFTRIPVIARICGFVAVLTSILVKLLGLLIAFSDLFTDFSEKGLLLRVRLHLARLVSHLKIGRITIICGHVALLCVLSSIGGIAEARKTNVIIDPNETVCLDGYAIQVPKGYPGAGRYLPCEKYDEFMETKNVKLLIGPMVKPQSNGHKLTI